MKLWRDSFAPNLIELTSDSRELNGDNPIVNMVATKSDDGNAIYIKAVNNLEKTADFVVTFDESIDITKAAIEGTIIVPTLNDGEEAKAKLTKRNSFKEPNAIAPQKLDVKVNGGKLVVSAEALSAFVVKISL